MTAHPVAPDLVPDFPILHAEGRQIPILDAQRAVFRSVWSVAVLDPRCRFFGSRATSLDVHCKRGLSAGGAREQQKLVGAKVARLRFVLPRKISPRDTRVAWSNAPHPVIVLRDVPARPANERRRQ